MIRIIEHDVFQKEQVGKTWSVTVSWDEPESPNLWMLLPFRGSSKVVDDADDDDDDDVCC